VSFLEVGGGCIITPSGHMMATYSDSITDPMLLQLSLQLALLPTGSLGLSVVALTNFGRGISLIQNTSKQCICAVLSMN